MNLRYWIAALNNKRAIVVISAILLVFIAGFAITYRYLDARLRGNSVKIVRAEEGAFNPATAPLPEGIEIITQEEFMLAMQEDEELTDEEFRQAIEREFNPDDTVRVDAIDEIAKLGIIDNIREQKEINSNIINILFLGDDARLHQNRGRSDSIVLISYNRDTRTIRLTSFMRDILVPINLSGEYWNRINTMYATGGPGRLINLLNDIFSMDIQRYAIVRFSGVFALVDALDGLEINLSEEEAMSINRIFPDFDEVSEGNNLLNGRQVLAYSRMRAIDHDLYRTQRHRNVLRTIFNKILDTKNVGDFFTIATFALDHVETNVPLSEIIAIGVELFTGSKPVIEEFRIPIDGTFNHAVYNKAHIFVIDFEKNILALHKSIYGSAVGIRTHDFTFPIMDDQPETNEQPKTEPPEELENGNADH